MIFLKMNAFEQAGRWLAAIFCQAIYPVITWLFDLFMTVAKIDILSTQDIQPIYQRITMILTIVMVFYVTFEFVKYVVQPDGITDKEKGAGNIIYKLIAVVILIAFVPKIFGWAYTIQGKILDAEIISKVIYGNSSVNTSEFGKNFSSNIFGMFYKVEPEFEGDSKQPVYEGIVSENLKALRENNSLSSLTAGLYDSSKITTPAGEEIEKARINFQAIFAIIVGGFIVYILALYCVDIGVRWAQMIFLQIMAPIAVIGYLAPKKDGIFQKWCKQCLTTYLDLFLRLAIIYFALLICEILTSSYANNSLFANLGDVGDTMKVFVYIVLVLGVLLFVKKAPDMLKELFPKTGAASGNFGLKPGERVPAAAARLAGAGLGMGLTGAKGLISRTRNAHLRNKERRAERNKARDERLANGDTRTERQVRRDNRTQRSAARSAYRKANRAYDKSAEETRRKLAAIDNDTTLSVEDRKNKKAEILKAHKGVAEQRKRAASDKTAYENAVLKDRQNRSENLFGAAAKGAVAGGYYGVKEGIKATKLEDIGKQVKAGAASNKEAISAREKWLDAGGTSYIDRVVSGVEQKIGIQTSAQRTEQEVKGIEDDIKTLEGLTDRESSIIKTADKVKDNNIKKMQEGKLQTPILADEEFKLRDPSGRESIFKVHAGETVSSAFGRVKTEVDVAEQKLKNAVDSGDATRIDAAKADLAMARQNAEQVGKKLHERSFDQILKAIAIYERDPREVNDPRGNKAFDAGSVQAAYETIWNIQNLRRIPETVAAMKQILEEPEFKAFMGETPIESFDTYDAIEKAVKTITGKRVEEISAKKAEQQRINTSTEYQTQKANDSTSGGKK